MGEGKKDRYNLGGTDDELGSSSDDDLESDTSESDDRDPDRDVDDTTSTNNSAHTDSPRTRGRENEESTSNPNSNSSGPDEIPHRVRYDSPKEARSTKTIALDDSDLERLSELESLAEQTFSEKTYQMDVYLGALRAGLYSGDEAFLEAMREIGYGYFD